MVFWQVNRYIFRIVDHFCTSQDIGPEYLSYLVLVDNSNR